MKKYRSTADIYSKGTPSHVRGSLLYNHYVNKFKLGLKYEKIREGDKIKFLYLKEPNPIKENTVAFVTKLPTEFDLQKYNYTGCYLISGPPLLTILQPPLPWGPRFPYWFPKQKGACLEPNHTRTKIKM